MIALVYTTVLSGGLVAGLNAGAQFNTFPLMAGQWIPDGLTTWNLGIQIYLKI